MFFTHLPTSPILFVHHLSLCQFPTLPTSNLLLCQAPMHKVHPHIIHYQWCTSPRMPTTLTFIQSIISNGSPCPPPPLIGYSLSSGSRRVPRGPCPPSPVQISHKKDGRHRWPHRFHVSCPPPPHPAAGSDAVHWWHDGTSFAVARILAFGSLLPASKMYRPQDHSMDEQSDLGLASNDFLWTHAVESSL